jgi:hypothetical protein
MNRQTGRYVDKYGKSVIDPDEWNKYIGRRMDRWRKKRKNEKSIKGFRHSYFNFLLSRS